MTHIGYIFLVLALLASAYSVVAFVLGARGRHRVLLESGRNGLLAVCGLVSLSVAALVYALLSHDFGIAYVADYSSRSMSFPYLLSALWAGNSGSLLFWAWLLSVFSAVAVLRLWRRESQSLPYASAVMMVSVAFFIILLLFVSNPFERNAVAPADGVGLNPLLENPGMIFHPPLLLGGYVALTLPFAFAVAALISGRQDDDWLLRTRGWAVLSWLLLGAGNVIGAWWAYVELGWGGYWAWDPVENAGLMPMLVITAFLHSSLGQRRRGMFKVWNMVLVMLAFDLAIFGTFLTRSGILSSVHTFPDTGLGPFFMAFLGISVVGSIALLLHRRADLESEAEVESFFSRESAFLLTNVLLVGATGIILLGTMFPLLSEIFVGRQVTLVQDFFNRAVSPVFLAILFLIAVCAFASWRQASARRLGRDLLWPAVAALVLIVVLLVVGVRQWYALLAFALCSFVLLAVLERWFREARARRRARGQSYPRAFADLLVANRPRYGGYLVHVGMLVMALGIIGSTAYAVEKEVVVTPGQSIAIDGYSLIYEGVEQRQAEDRLILDASLEVYNGGRSLGSLTPQKNFHRSFDQPVSEVAIRSNLVEDLYVVLIDSVEDGRASFLVKVNPMVSWIWIGGTVFVVGGVVALWPGGRPVPASPRARRRRR